VLGLKNHLATLEAQIQEINKRKPDDGNHSLALEQAAKYVEKLDRWLKNANVRRINLLRILECFCRPVDQETDIPAASNSAVTQDEVKQIVAPPVVLPKSVIGDITTQAHGEKVELVTQ
jgi:hypothetical protein